MTDNMNAETVDVTLELIEHALSGIEEGGGDSDLRDLRLLLVELMALLDRDPGIAKAAEDLYAVAVAIVTDCVVGLPLDPRKLHLLGSSRRRLRDRLEGPEPAWAEPRGRFLQLRTA
jgi:hypothetical protein